MEAGGADNVDDPSQPGQLPGRGDRRQQTGRKEGGETEENTTEEPNNTIIHINDKKKKRKTETNRAWCLAVSQVENFMYMYKVLSFSIIKGHEEEAFVSKRFIFR